MVGQRIRTLPDRINIRQISVFSEQVQAVKINRSITDAQPVFPEHAFGFFQRFIGRSSPVNAAHQSNILIQIIFG